MPYESARTRSLLGSALDEQGDHEAAAMEYRAARSVLANLGADGDVERLTELLGETRAEVKGDRVTRTFVFTDIATSTDLIGLIGDSAWEDLLAWHDRVMRETIARAGGEVITHTGDGFFIAFASPDAAIEWAVLIQRRLAKHRQDHGFAPEVRIGIHTAEATSREGNYSGRGVHVASRVMSSAEGGHIHASTETIGLISDLACDVRDLGEKQLKGINDPVEVSEVVWSDEAPT
jgi:class 3 adenylate cyclase